MTDDDITRGNHGGNEFSDEAFERTPGERRQRDRSRILVAIRQFGPQTCEELELRLGMSHQTCSARVSELRRDDAVRTVGRRKTISGATAAVHGLADKPSVVST